MASAVAELNVIVVLLITTHNDYEWYDRGDMWRPW